MAASNKKYDFSGKVALVTGSSAGIGAGIALQLAQYGAKVTITGRNAENLAKVAQQVQQASAGGVAPLQIVGDLITDDSLPKKLIDQTVAKFGRLDFLVNNAGWTSTEGTLASAKLLETFDQLIKLNLRSVVELTQLAVPHLEKTKGSIVNISSVAAIYPIGVVYGASKAALDMVTKTSALELGPKGIRVNSVNPGGVRTSIGRSMNMDETAADKLWTHFGNISLMKRIAEPEDIANLTSFLLSDDAKNITGSIMVSDSGFLLSPPNMDLEAALK